MDNAASTSKGASTPPESLSTMLNTLQMEEENLGFPPFLLSFDVFNYNFHNYLVASGTTANIKLLSIANNINAQ